MPIQYRRYETLMDATLLEGVWHLLCRYDSEFIPPLSAREHTYQSDLTAGSAATQEPKRYFEKLKEQSFLLAQDQDQVVGFMSFRPQYVYEDSNGQLETIYVTTVIVDQAFRGQGITTHLYKELEVIAKARNLPIMTRTWSTNNGHIRVLHRIGMQEVQRIKDGRGPGLDTVYYRKDI
ncbi:GNAT family N-acetyltransferase [Paenibacillus rubinfantis]|uniref:GNAT family N-acetyltransferase n=1 Tax=Paenibacillus rubinfantis TaxID=1720296 RepID=UPI00073F899C|nr:GNAT family N-acetyltransferase [Paenibacillus rubinfantis]